MSRQQVICRNPNCFACFPNGNKAKSRPLPVDLVNMAAIDAYYDANPDQARHRSPDHVCVNCRRSVGFPTWRQDHLRKYVAPPLPSSCLFYLIHARQSYPIRALYLVAQLASTRRWRKRWATRGRVAGDCPVCPLSA